MTKTGGISYGIDTELLQDTDCIKNMDYVTFDGFINDYHSTRRKSYYEQKYNGYY